MQLGSVSFPFDEWYVSNQFENGIQLVGVPKALGSFYVFAQATVYVLLLDSATGHAAPSTGGPGRIYPVPAGTYISSTWHGGADFQNGIYVGAYSTAALAAAGGVPDGGANLWIEAYWRRGRIPNPR